MDNSDMPKTNKDFQENDEDFFQTFINYNGDEDIDVGSIKQDNNATAIQFTFLKPNIDVSNSKKNNQHLYGNPSFMIDEPTCELDDFSFEFEIVEQPQQCRISNYGAKDRRPIDPAPILRLRILNEKTVDFPPFFVVQVSLWSADMKRQLDLVKNKHQALRTLMGSVVASPSLLKDLDGQEAYYFAFPDLSVRMTGEYRLQFTLMHLTRSKIIKSLFSEPFTVYSAKAYPGMKESSELAKHLFRQGLKLTIRTQNSARDTVK
ncbi:velvet factor-domain-containing protein [Gilbertella persicaria]|uniref:velvet factor-domain-containing protein n=1 Tax=Gilbertella persicaria TaxID=101096 RepID=UPI00221FEA1D|nr:velvet factor-domain-containing protein [Gilbertella persicaria]KAI8075868.1 velvet factor-domain-containing protein [Gilbertella persicaria]